MVVDALNNLDWKPKTLAVRINDIETPHCHADIIEVVTGAGEKLDTIILTKVKNAHHVMFVHYLLDQLEAQLGLSKRIGIECLIEEVEGMMNVEEIAACSDRIECLIIVGANPVVSKWSFLQVPNPGKRLREIEARGGKIWIVDPRKTETAKVAGEHVAIRPGMDVFFYLSFLNELIA